MYDDGQRMVIKGQEMNDLVAVQMGFKKDMDPGDRYIQDGRKTIPRRPPSLAQGEKTFMANMNTPSVTNRPQDDVGRLQDGR